MNSLFRIHNSVSRFLRTMFFCVLVFCACGICWGAATTKHAWAGTTDNNWGTANNWKAGDNAGNWSNTRVVPAAGNIVYINTNDVNGDITINLTDDVDLGTSYIYFECGYASPSTITINLNGHSLKAANIVFGNPTSVQNQNIQLNIAGPGTFEATDLTYKSSSNASAVNVTDGATVKTTNFTNSGGASSSLKISTDSNSSVEGVSGSGVELSPAASTWTGATDTDWDTASNWNHGVPTEDTVVTIPDKTNKPSKSGDITIKSLILQDGMTLTVTGKITVLEEASLGGSITSSDIQTYTVAVTLTDDTTLNAGSSNITFGDTVTGNHKLITTATETIFGGNVNAGDISITGSLGTAWLGEVGVPAIKCGGLAVSENAMFRGPVTAASVDVLKDISIMESSGVTTTGIQHYGGEVLIQKGITLKGLTVTFDSTVDRHGDGAVTYAALTITGNAVFSGNAGSIRPLKSLSVSGTTSLGADVTVDGDGASQTYTGAVTLTGDVVLTAPQTAATTANITFGSKINSDSNATPRNLAVKCYKITTRSIGNTGILKNITVEGIFNVEEDSPYCVKCEGDLTVAKNPNQTFAASTVIATIRGSVDAASVNISDGTTVFGHKCEYVKTSGDQTYNGNVRINNNTVEAGHLFAGTTDGITKITINGSLNCNESDPHPVVFGSSTVKVTTNISGIIGASDSQLLSNLTVFGPITLAESVKTAGDQTYNGLVTLNGAVKFTAGTDANKKTVTFGSAGITQSIKANSYKVTITGNAEIYGENIFESLLIDNSTIESATSVNFEGGKLQKIGSITAKGKDESNKLTLGSTDTNNWKVYFATKPTATDFSYTEISSSESVVEAGTSYNDLEITPAAANIVDADPTGPSAIGWFVKKYFWIGKTNSKWSEASNWAYDEEGNLAAPVPSFSDGLSQIELKKLSGGKDIEFADETATVPATITIKSLVVNENNRLGLAAYNLEAVSPSAGAITNNGTIASWATQAGPVLTASGTGGTVVHGGNSFIEYYGAGPATDVLYVSQTGTSPDFVNSYNHVLLNMDNGATLTFNNEVNAKSVNSNSAAGASAKAYTVNFEKAFKVTDDTKDCIFGNFENTDAKAKGIPYDTVTVNLSGDFTAVVQKEAVFCGPLNILSDNKTIKVTNGSVVITDGPVDATGKTITVKAKQFQCRKGLTAKYLAVSVSTGGEGLWINPSETVSPDSAVSVETCYLFPGNLILENNASLTCSILTTIYGTTVNNGTITCTSTTGDGYGASFTGSYSGTGRLTCAAGSTTFGDVLDLSNAAGFSHNDGTVILSKNGNALINKADGTTTFNNLQIGSTSSNDAVSAENDFKIEGNLTVKKPFTAQGVTFSGAASVLSAEKMFTAKNLTVDTGKALSCGTSNITLSGNFANNGTFTAGTSKIIINGTDETVISGETSFYDLECKAAGKVIKFEAGKTQTVTNSFTVTGTAVSPTEDYSKHISLISDTDNSPWNMDCTGATVNVQYAKIKDSNNVSMTTDTPAVDRYLEAKYSWDDGNNVKWNFPGMLYTWTGATNSTWNVKENWHPASIPGADSRTKIPDVSAASNNFPELDAAVSVAQINIEENSWIDLKGQALTISATDSDSYKNEGTVKTAGTETVTLPSAAGAVSENGVWEYYGGTVKAISNLSYNKIIVTDAVNISGTVKANEFKVATTAAVTCAADSAIDAPVIIASSPAAAGYSFDCAGKSLTFKDTVATANNAGATYSLKLNDSSAGAGAATGEISFEAAVSVKEIVSDSKVKFGAVEVSSEESQTYNKPVVLTSAAGAAVFKVNAASYNVIFEDTITGSGKNIEFAAADTAAADRNVIVKASVSGVDKFVSYYPVEFDSSTAAFEVATASGIVLHQDSTATGSNKVTFNSKIDSGSAGAKIKFTAGTALVQTPVAFNGIAGSTIPLETVKAYGQVDFGANLTGSAKSVVTSGNQYYYGPVVAQENAVLVAAEGALQFANNISGTGSVSVLSDCYITDACTVSATFTVGGTSVGASKNLHISAGASAINFVDLVTVYGNAIFYGGTIGVQQNFQVSNDLVVLGANYKTDDDAPLASGIPGLFAYNHSSRTSANGYAPVSYSEAFKTQTPDSNPIPDGSAASKFSATVSVAPGITITIGKNFYANGTTLSGTAAWNLVILNNDNQTSNFAELYNSTINNCTVLNGWISASENCSGTGNSQVDFTHPLIAEAYTVFDDVIFVKFVESGTGNSKAIENSNNEINKAVSKISNSAGFYTAAFIDPDCTQTTDGKGDLSQFYLRFGDGTDSSTKWNTDANGISAGDAQSTDRNGEHHSVIPYLNLPKALSDLYASLRDCHKSRIAHYYSASPSVASENEAEGACFTKVPDKSAPVLIQVRTGQEKHVAPDAGSGQPEYDGHNFIEISYSEPVNIGGITGKLMLPVNPSSLTAAETAASKNVQATAALGGITNSGSGFTVASLASFASGSVYTGTAGADDNISVHSLYRVFDASGAGDAYQTHKIRLGIAGFVDNTAFSTTAGSINHWLGYIKSAAMPAGVVSRAANSLITDTSGNVLEHSDVGHSTKHALPVINLNSSLPSPSVNYGAWDVSGPVFAPYNSKVTGLSDFCEAVGYTDNPSSPYLDRIEFHMVDSASMLSLRKWYTKVGWAVDESSAVEVPAKDTAGGAKPFDVVTGNRSAGGIRYSTIYDKVSHFKYSVTGGVTDRSFAGTTVGKTSSSLFISATGGTLSVDDYDSLYFALKLSDADLSLKTTFEIAYDGNGYITDLAGNLLLPGVNTVVKSIDRVAPNFNISVASVKTEGGVSGDELYVIFSKALQLGEFQIKKSGQPDQVKNGLADIPKSLRLVEIDSSGSSVTISNDLKIDDTTPARLVFENKDYTGLILKLNRTVTLADMEKYSIQCYIDSQSTDPVSGTDAYVTYIQDELGNYMRQYEAHALTDFAVGVVTPVYAYDSSLMNSKVQQGQMYKDGSWAVHDWSRNQQNYGSLAYGYDIFLSAKLNDGSSDGVSELPAYIALYMASLSKISGNALSNTVNKNTGSNWRMWMPEKTVDNTLWPVFDAVSEVSNSSYGMLSLPVDTEEPAVLDFSFDELKFDSFIKSEVGSGGNDQVLFLFGLQKDGTGAPVTICHAPEYSDSQGKYNMVQMPLFVARLENSSDLTSLDLWSLRLKDIISQRGNVTILNNVINASNGELTTVKVNMPSEGNLNVIVMTLDGNIVQYLQHGRASAGEHNYVWNGTTKSGKKVARGMYFVRVFGSGIDETRKVMVVKD